MYIFTRAIFRTKEAQEVYEKALFYDRNNPDIYYNVSFNYPRYFWNQNQPSACVICLSIPWQLGVVLLEQGKPSQALAYLERALELEPDHQASLLNSAIVLQEMAANDKGHQDVRVALKFALSECFILHLLYANIIFCRTLIWTRPKMKSTPRLPNGVDGKPRNV